MKLRSTLRRWHIWLGWLIGVPMLFWSLSGVLMVIRPIEEVRGTALLADMPPVRSTTPPIAPAIDIRPLTKLTLEQRAAGPRWVLSFADGASRLADPASGRLLPKLSAADAMREVMVRYQGKAKVIGATRTDPANPPIELRRSMDGWMVAMSDGTHFYVDGGSGEVVARRTRWWRIYDVMWGLHIMDLQTREDAHNPWLIGFGITAAITTLLALILLPLTTRRKKKNGKQPS
ncbi:MAG: hypothetical protein ABI617_02535 [Sphingomicrobium sp.]